MLTYTVRLPGARTLDGRVSGRVLGNLMHAVSHAAAGALRLRVEGRSTTRADRLPAWVEEGTEFVLLDFLQDEPGLVLGARSLEDALPDRFVQGDLFSPIDPGQSAISLMAASLAEAAAGHADSDAFDIDLLGVFARDFSRVFKRSHVETISVQNGAVGSPRVELDAEGLRTVGRLRDRTPRPQRVRLAGHLDVIKYSTCAFLMRLADGTQVRGVLVDESAEVLRPHFGTHVAVEGTAQFRPSGALLRVDVDRIAPASERDLHAFSGPPRAIDGPSDVRRLRRPQTATSGVNAIIGRWPGDETDEEVERTLREVS
jgi:hypothetical protein